MNPTTDNGVLLATYMSDWNITFKRSLNRGQSWSSPIYVSGTLQADKNWISMDPSDQSTLYVTFNSMWPYEVHSFDQGESWSEPLQLDEIEGTYFFGCGSVVRSDGTSFIAYTAVADGNFSTSYARVYSSNDHFSTFTVHQIDYWTGFQECPVWADCGSDYLNGACSLSIDAGDNVYYTYNAYSNHGEDIGYQQVSIIHF